MKYLLDTNVVCEATAKHPHATVLAWIEAHAHECFLSSLLKTALLSQLRVAAGDRVDDGVEN